MENEEIRQYHLEQAVIKLYSGGTGSGKVKRFCQVHNLSYDEVRRIAIKAGIYQTNRPGRQWNAKEKEVLIIHKDKSYEHVRHQLKNEGFIRSESSIASQARRMLLASGGGPVDNDREWYTLQNLSEIMGIYPKVIMNWIEKGLLKAKKADTSLKSTYYKIYPKNIRLFIINHVGIVEVAKIDKFWLVDLLTNQKAGR